MGNTQNKGFDDLHDFITPFLLLGKHQKEDVYIQRGVQLIKKSIGQYDDDLVNSLLRKMGTLVQNSDHDLTVEEYFPCFTTDQELLTEWNTLYQSRPHLSMEELAAQRKEIQEEVKRQFSIMMCQLLPDPTKV